MHRKTPATAAATRQSGSWRGLWLQAGLVLLGACAAPGPADRETSRAYGGVTSDELYDQTLEALRASDLEVIEAEPRTGVITAAGSFDDRGWAECTAPLGIVRDSEARSSVVPAAEGHREIELTASVSGAANGALLTLSPTFSAEPESPMATTGECTTTRVLERQILETVAKTA
jgi:hypothetical protein